MQRNRSSMQHVSRRNFMAITGTALASTAVGRSTAMSSTIIAQEEDELNIWKYIPLDPNTVAEDAYRLYMEKHCMYAAFRGICDNVAKASQSQNPLLKQSLDIFPYQMMKYGSGGCGKYGTLCGAINGTAAAISLFVFNETDAFAMITELMLWYENTALPIFQPRNRLNYESVKDDEMLTSISKSPLCHVSNTKWCKEALVPIASDLRKERCSRVSADCAAMGVELLNRYSQDGKCTFANIAEPEKKCLICHGANGSVENVANKMNCTQCHGDLPADHSTKIR